MVPPEVSVLVLLDRLMPPQVGAPGLPNDMLWEPKVTSCGTKDVSLNKFQNKLFETLMRQVFGSSTLSISKQADQDAGQKVSPTASHQADQHIAKPASLHGRSMPVNNH